MDVCFDSLSVAGIVISIILVYLVFMPLSGNCIFQKRKTYHIRNSSKAVHYQ